MFPKTYTFEYKNYTDQIFQHLEGDLLPIVEKGFKDLFDIKEELQKNAFLNLGHLLRNEETIKIFNHSILRFIVGMRFQGLFNLTDLFSDISKNPSISSLGLELMRLIHAEATIEQKNMSFSNLKQLQEITKKTRGILNIIFNYIQYCYCETNKSTESNIHKMPDIFLQKIKETLSSGSLARKIANDKIEIGQRIKQRMVCKTLFSTTSIAIPVALPASPTVSFRSKEIKPSTSPGIGNRK